MRCAVCSHLGTTILSAFADIVPVIDVLHEKEYIWYRKDFGTSFGWREVRGMQVVALNNRREMQLQTTSPPTQGIALECQGFPFRASLERLRL